MRTPLSWPIPIALLLAACNSSEEPSHIEGAPPPPPTLAGFRVCAAENVLPTGRCDTRDLDTVIEIEAGQTLPPLHVDATTASGAATDFTGKVTLEAIDTSGLFPAQVPILGQTERILSAGKGDFPGLRIERAAGNLIFRVSAASSSPSSQRQRPIRVRPAAPERLAWTSSLPSSVVAGSDFPPFKLQLLDRFGNPITSSGPVRILARSANSSRLTVVQDPGQREGAIEIRGFKLTVPHSEVRLQASVTWTANGASRAVMSELSPTVTIVQPEGMMLYSRMKPLDPRNLNTETFNADERLPEIEVFALNRLGGQQFPVDLPLKITFKGSGVSSHLDYRQCPSGLTTPAQQIESPSEPSPDPSPSEDQALHGPVIDLSTGDRLYEMDFQMKDGEALIPRLRLNGRNSGLYSFSILYRGAAYGGGSFVVKPRPARRLYFAHPLCKTYGPGESLGTVRVYMVDENGNFSEPASPPNLKLELLNGNQVTPLSTAISSYVSSTENWRFSWTQFTWIFAPAAGSRYVLRASAPGMGVATSSPFSVATLCHPNKTSEEFCTDQIPHAGAASQNRTCNESGTGWAVQTPCQPLSCETGYHIEANACVLDRCKPGSTQTINCLSSARVMEPNAAAAFQTDTCKSDGSDWQPGACAVTACNANHYLNGSQCKPGCAPASVTSVPCDVPNGRGSISRACSADGASYSDSSCVMTSCNSGYRPSGGMCELDNGLGASCSSNYQCASTLTCVSGSCRSRSFTGGSCDDSLDCVSFSDNCRSGRCSCRSIGCSCSFNSDCDYGNVCKYGSCARCKSYGETCFLSSDCCGFSYCGGGNRCQ